MPGLTKEGRSYIVYSLVDNYRYSIVKQTWEEVEDYIAKEPGVYAIYSIDAYEVPLTGLKLHTTTQQEKGLN